MNSDNFKNDIQNNSHVTPEVRNDQLNRRLHDHEIFARNSHLNQFKDEQGIEQRPKNSTKFTTIPAHGSLLHSEMVEQLDDESETSSGSDSSDSLPQKSNDVFSHSTGSGSSSSKPFQNPPFFFHMQSRAQAQAQVQPQPQPRLQSQLGQTFPTNQEYFESGRRIDKTLEEIRKELFSPLVPIDFDILAIPPGWKQFPSNYFDGIPLRYPSEGEELHIKPDAIDLMYLWEVAENPIVLALVPSQHLLRAFYLRLANIIYLQYKVRISEFSNPSRARQQLINRIRVFVCREDDIFHTAGDPNTMSSNPLEAKEKLLAKISRYFLEYRDYKNKVHPLKNPISLDHNLSELDDVIEEMTERSIATESYLRVLPQKLENLEILMNHNLESLRAFKLDQDKLVQQILDLRSLMERKINNLESQLENIEGNVEKIKETLNNQ